METVCDAGHVAVESNFLDILLFTTYGHAGPLRKRGAHANALQCARITCSPHPSHKSNKSSSSSQPPLLCTRIFPPPPPPSFSSFSAIAPNSSFNCSSVTFDLSCPLLASIMSRFSTSAARDSFTSRIRPRRSAASGVKTWERIELRASAGETRN